MATMQQLDQADVFGGSVAFRAVNDIVRRLAEQPVDDVHDFVCECEDETCARVLRMTGAEYDALRADADCFAVLPGHERRETAEAVGRTDSYVIVRRPRPLAPAPPPSRKAAA